MAAGVAAVFAFPLQVGGIRLGVLDLYRDTPGPPAGRHSLRGAGLRGGRDRGAAAPAGVVQPVRRAASAAHRVHRRPGRDPPGNRDDLRAGRGVSLVEALLLLRARVVLHESDDAGGVPGRAGSPPALRSRHPIRTTHDQAGRAKGPEPGRWVSMTRQERVTQVLVELADTLVVGFDVIDFLHTLVERSVELLAADAAGLMLAEPAGQPRGGGRIVGGSQGAGTVRTAVLPGSMHGLLHHRRAAGEHRRRPDDRPVAVVRRRRRPSPGTGPRTPCRCGCVGTSSAR